MMLSKIQRRSCLPFFNLRLKFSSIDTSIIDKEQKYIRNLIGDIFIEETAISNDSEIDIKNMTINISILKKSYWHKLERSSSLTVLNELSDNREETYYQSYHSTNTSGQTLIYGKTEAEFAKEYVKWHENLQKKYPNKIIAYIKQVHNDNLYRNVILVGESEQEIFKEYEKAIKQNQIDLDIRLNFVSLKGEWAV